MARVGFGRAVGCLVVGCVGLAAGCGDEGAGPSGPGSEPPVQSEASQHIDAVLARFHVEPTVSSRTESSVRVSLPVAADGAFELEDRVSGLSIRVGLVGARSVPRSGDGERALFVGAAEHGGDVILQRHVHGVEDFVVFEREPAEEAVRYHLDVGTVAGLRLVDDVLELQTADGTPRLRMERPWVADGRGARARARVTVEDCAHAVDSPPFETPREGPGSRSCTVKVAWSARAGGLEYPLLLDPNWSNTANTMSSTRRAMTGTRLLSGKVLIAGGLSQANDSLSSVDLFDPTNNIFAAVKPMGTARHLHTATRVGSGATERVLVTGGIKTLAGASVVHKSTEIYDVTTETWSAGPDMSTPRCGHASALNSSGHVLTTGGYYYAGANIQATAELWNGTVWSAADAMSVPRVYHQALAANSTEI